MTQPTGIHARRFMLALLAQIVFCLVAAPILSAERWAGNAPSADDRQGAPHDSRPLVHAAFDASDVRPEEVTEGGQTRGKSRSKNGRSSGRAGATSVKGWRQSACTSLDAMQPHGEEPGQAAAGSCTTVGRPEEAAPAHAPGASVDLDCFTAPALPCGVPCALAPTERPIRATLARENFPALQPTGPPN